MSWLVENWNVCHEENPSRYESDSYSQEDNEKSDNNTYEKYDNDDIMEEMFVSMFWKLHFNIKDWYRNISILFFIFEVKNWM